MWCSEVVVVANNKIECLECNPPRTFRSIPGLQGHMQFKHDKSGAYTERPPSKQTEMIQQLLDQQEHLLNQQDKLVNQQQALYALIAERSGKPIGSNEPIGVFSDGSGNQANNHQGNNNAQGNNAEGNNSGNGDQGDDEQAYFCDDCQSPVFAGQERCPSCKSRMNWNGVAVN